MGSDNYREALMLRSHCWLACTVGALICGNAPFAVDAQESLTDDATEHAAPRFTTLDIFGGDIFAIPSINDRRMVTGSYVPAEIDAPLTGFVLLDRFLHPIVFENWGNVVMLGNNDRGEIVGLVSTSLRQIAFRYTRGKVEDVSVPGASTTTARDINNRGDMVGVLRLNNVGHGYLLSGDRLTLIDGPDSDGTTRIFGTIVFGLNDKREVVGCYEPIDRLRARRGFVFRKGTYEIVDVPGAHATCTIAINNRGQIVGGYSVAGDDRFHGFLFSKGRYMTLDIPNARQTTITSINDFGDIVGIYQDASFIDHAFKSNVREFISRRSGHR
jgi:probable HAF family extracellular repeat protein